MKNDDCPLLIYRLTEAEKDIVRVDLKVDALEGKVTPQLERLKEGQMKIRIQVSLAAAIGSIVGGAAVAAAAKMLIGG